MTAVRDIRERMNVAAGIVNKYVVVIQGVDTQSLDDGLLWLSVKVVEGYYSGRDCSFFVGAYSLDDGAHLESQVRATKQLFRVMGDLEDTDEWLGLKLVARLQMSRVHDEWGITPLVEGFSYA